MSTPQLTSDDIAEVDAEKLGSALSNSLDVTIGEITVTISPHARDVLVHLFGEIAAGHRVDVATVPEMLTTQEAADLIRVSRPTLVKMLNDGLMEFEQPGVQRRVPRAEVDRFLADRRVRRSHALEAFVETGDGEVDQIVSTR